MAEVIKNRYEFVVLFDVENGNPNGDPDAGNLPRIDPESGYGIVTDVCLKRKIRNYVETLKEDEPGYKIYIREDVPLNRSDNTAYIELKTDEKGIKELKKKDPQVDQKIRDFMCRNFFDIRTFGAVMTTFVKAALNCGQVRGPVQLGFARSIDPIVSQEVTITRVAITTEKDAENKSTESFPTPCTAQRGTYQLIWPENPRAFQKRIWNFCGMPSSICLKLTIPQPGEKWRYAGSLCLNTVRNWEIVLRTNSLMPWK